MEAGLKELTKALMKFQSEMSPIKREAKNPGFKRADGKPSTYADFASTIEAIREPMAECGLAFTQLLGGAPDGVTVRTILLHVSGESIESTAWSPVAQQTPQAIGSATTYLKRYALWAILGLATEDDDGNVASQKAPKKPEAPAEKVTPKADVAKMTTAFAGLGVTEEALAERLGHSLDRVTHAEFADLRKFFDEKRKLAAETPEEVAKRLEQLAAEQGIAKEAAEKAAKAAAVPVTTFDKPPLTKLQQINAVFDPLIKRVKEATTKEAAALIVAEAGHHKILGAPEIKALTRALADRCSVLDDRARTPAPQSTSDVPF